MRKHVCVTGTIGSGKSYISSLFVRLGYMLFDADQAVHELFKRKDIIQKIAEISTSSFIEGKIDRTLLGQDVFSDTAKLQQVEALLHPLVDQARTVFTTAQKLKGKYCVHEIPLYFETGMSLADTAVVVTLAPAFLIQERALARPTMTQKKLSAILRRQWPDHKKQQKADFVVHTGLSKGYSWEQVQKIVHMMEKN